MKMSDGYLPDWRLVFDLLVCSLYPTVESGEWEEPPVAKLMEFNYEEVKSQVQARGYPLVKSKSWKSKLYFLSPRLLSRS